MEDTEEQELKRLMELFPHSIVLTKGPNGGYGWTINVRYPPDSENAIPKMVEVVKAIDARLQSEFGGCTDGQ